MKDTTGGMEDWPQSGMTLRQWYAGQALPSCIYEAARTVNKYVDVTLIAKKAFAIADAMIEEGNKE